QFIQLISAVIGGYFLVLSQKISGLNVATPAILLTLGITVCFLLLLYFNTKAWLGFRQAEYELIRIDAVKPKGRQSIKQEIAMGIAMFVMGAGTMLYFAL